MIATYEGEFDPLWVKVVNSLREQILRGELRHGEVLSENKLAAEFDVSRTPVREALRILMEEGLVEMLPGRKVRVVIPRLEDITEIYQIRWVLESAALRELGENPVLAKKVCKEMKACLARARLALADEDTHQLALANENFHGVLISALRNQRISAQFKAIHNLITLYRSHTLKSNNWAVAGDEEHIQLVALIEAEKIDEAMALLKQHLCKAKKILREYLEH
ncbi:MAG: GntR family transcriptional regulator [Pusillimonas sp.]